MSTQERNDLITHINVVLEDGVHTRNFLRKKCQEAEQEHGMCSSGRRQVYENLSLTEGGISIPADERYSYRRGDYDLPQEEVRGLENPEWYTLEGLRGLLERTERKNTEYKDHAFTWISDNYRDASLPVSFMNTIAAYFGKQEFPKSPVYLSFTFEASEVKLPADFTQTESELKQLMQDAILNVLPAGTELGWDDDTITIDEGDEY